MLFRGRQAVYIKMLTKLLPFIILTLFAILVIAMGISLLFSMDEIEKLKLTQDSNPIAIKDLCQESLSIKNTMRTFSSESASLLNKYHSVNPN